MREFKFEIEKNFGAFGDRDSRGFQKELTLTSYNGAPAKYDLRGWDEDHKTLSKGLTLTHEELLRLKALLNQIETEPKH